MWVGSLEGDDHVGGIIVRVMIMWVGVIVRVMIIRVGSL